MLALLRAAGGCGDVGGRSRSGGRSSSVDLGAVVRTLRMLGLWCHMHGGSACPAQIVAAVEELAYHEHAAVREHVFLTLQVIGPKPAVEYCLQVRMCWLYWYKSTNTDARCCAGRQQRACLRLSGSYVCSRMLTDAHGCSRV